MTTGCHHTNPKRKRGKSQVLANASGWYPRMQSDRVIIARAVSWSRFRSGLVLDVITEQQVQIAEIELAVSDHRMRPDFAARRIKFRLLWDRKAALLLPCLGIGFNE